MARNLLELFLVFLTIGALALHANTTGAGATPAENCGFMSELQDSLSDPAHTVEVWAPASNHLCWRAFGFVLAAEAVNDPRVTVRPTAFNTLNTPFENALLAAFADGRGPDIANTRNFQAWRWVDQGYLSPLDDCLARHPEFDAVRPELWDLFRYRNRIWHVPYSVSIELLYFSKERLRALGWSDGQIENLPRRIETGEFTLGDLLATAQLAVDRGIVEPGFGFWPNYTRHRTMWLAYIAHGGRLSDPQHQRLVITQGSLAQAFEFQRTAMAAKLTPAIFSQFRDGGAWPGGAIWRDATAHGRVLFWQGTNEHWANYIEAVRKRGGEPYLLETVGVALFPNAQRNQPGRMLVYDYDSYVLASKAASGREQQEVACALLAKLFTPAISARHAQKSKLLSTLDSQARGPALASDWFTQQTSAMWEYAVLTPKHVEHFFDVNYTYMVFEFQMRVEQGELSPHTAAMLAVQTLQSQLGDAIEVE